jgi:NAD(P)-dependent dehydrogenase (short-subunit alcohol dehydrogenase family)
VDLEQAAFRAATGLLDGRVVILTGATGGIGKTIARMLVAAGARVAVTTRCPSSLQRPSRKRQSERGRCSVASGARTRSPVHASSSSRRSRRS